MKPQKKVTNERAPEYDFSIVVKISKPKKNEPINEHAPEFGQLIPVLQLAH
jgi:hypothetical protein